METGTFRVKVGLAQMLKGGVIMDVVTAEHAKIAEDAGACSADTTSMITPPCSIWARPTFTRNVPVSILVS